MIILDTLPIFLVAYFGSTETVLFYSCLSLFLNRVLVEFDVVTWLLPVTTIAYTIGGIISSFFIGGLNIPVISALVMVLSRSLGVIDGLVTRFLLFREKQPGV